MYIYVSMKKGDNYIGVDDHIDYSFRFKFLKEVFKNYSAQYQLVSISLHYLNGNKAVTKEHKDLTWDTYESYL